MGCQVGGDIGGYPQKVSKVEILKSVDNFGRTQLLDCFSRSYLHTGGDRRRSGGQEWQARPRHLFAWRQTHGVAQPPHHVATQQSELGKAMSSVFDVNTTSSKGLTIPSVSHGAWRQLFDRVGWVYNVVDRTSTDFYMFWIALGPTPVFCKGAGRSVPKNR